MANKSILVVFLIVFLGISLIVTIPIFTISIQLSTYDVIEITDNSFIYAPANSSPIEKLNIYAELGDIEIKYVSPIVNYFAMIEVKIKMSGNNLAGKDYKDIFEVDWDDSSPSPSFKIELKSDVDQLEVLSLIKNVTIVVNLRADIIYDITATVIRGNVDLIVPFGVTCKNMEINISTKGNILFDVANCFIGGNITGIINEGNIELKTYNVEYTRNSMWTLITELGDITIDIVQYKDLGANITGNATIFTEGNLYLYYKDNKPSVGARFILLRKATGVRDFFGDYPNNIIGFEKSYLSQGRGTVYTSYDFPATNCYNLSLESPVSYYGDASSD